MIREFGTESRSNLPSDLTQVREMVDEMWGRVYDQAVLEVRAGRQPSWGANARYMILLKHQAWLEGDKSRVRVIGDTLAGLRERESKGETEPMGPKRTRPSDFDVLFGGFDLVRKLRAIMDAR